MVEALKFSDPRHGPALGLFDKSSYPACRTRLTAGDLILLFSDGLYEATNSEGEEYGQDRLLALVRKSLRHPTESLLHNLLAETQKFSGMAEFNDDVCLVGVDVAKTGG